jgi:hypothetical protein
MRALSVSHLEGVQKSSKYCPLRRPPVQESSSTRVVNKGGKLEINRFSRECFQYDITDGAALLQVRVANHCNIHICSFYCKRISFTWLGCIKFFEGEFKCLATYIYIRRIDWLFFLLYLRFSNVFIFYQQHTNSRLQTTSQPGGLKCLISSKI